MIICQGVIASPWLCVKDPGHKHSLAGQKLQTTCYIGFFNAKGHMSKIVHTTIGMWVPTVMPNLAYKNPVHWGHSEHNEHLLAGSWKLLVA